jgi:selenocysteine lyase/cysteine desulfurase
MAVLIRDMVDRHWLHERHRFLRERALSVWRRIPNLQVLGHEPGRAALPIFPLVFRDAARRPIDPVAAARALSDRYGLQVRGGCSCAGPYGHRLLGIGRLESESLLARIAAGEVCAKPGWVRLNLSSYLEDSKADWIIETIADFAHAVGRSGDWQGDAAFAAVTQAADPAARTG